MLLVLSQISHKKNLGLGPELFAQQSKPHQQALLDATKLLAQGQIIAAHEKAVTVTTAAGIAARGTSTPRPTEMASA